jgi:hypothetical protein
MKTRPGNKIVGGVQLSLAEMKRRRARLLLRTVSTLLLWCLAERGANHASAQPPAVSNAPARITALKTEMDQAMEKVRQIVNQPVARYARTRGIRVGEFSPGWFHEGAQQPDFNTVDVRTTQEKMYDKFDYVTSDLNPGVVFVGSQLEFNSMTKYFYTDRTIPKKKLTEAEMIEINRLYRIIGRCEQQLAQLENPAPAKPAESAESDAPEVRQPIPRSRYIKSGLGILVVLALYAVYRCRR